MITKRGWVILSWIFLAIMANAANMFSDRFGLPNLSVPLRELFLYGLLVATLPIMNLFNRKGLAVLIFCLMAFVTVYVVISAWENKHFQGLYYLRIYITPILFMICVLSWLRVASKLEIIRVCRILFWMNGVIMLVGLGIYVAMQMKPYIIKIIFSTQQLPWSWYIGGGLLRMGFPFSAPNNLGSYAALNVLLIFPLLIKGTKEIISKLPMLILLILNVLALTLSFSRSAMLTLLVGLIIICMLPGVVTQKNIFRLLVTLLLGILVIIFSLMVVDFINNGAVGKWIFLNTSLQDPSMQGHYSSVVTALSNFDQYFLAGYPRGTVGPRAEIFTIDFYNVENSALGVIFDMGLPCGILFFAIYMLLVKEGYVGLAQLPVLIGFFINLQLLPYIFAPEVMGFFLFVYLILGALQKHSLVNFEKVTKSFVTSQQFGGRNLAG